MESHTVRVCWGSNARKHNLRKKLFYMKKGSQYWHCDFSHSKTTKIFGNLMKADRENKWNLYTGKNELKKVKKVHMQIHCLAKLIIQVSWQW